MYSLKFIDARLVLTFGFALVSIACIIDGHLSSAWSGSNFGLSQAIMAVGLAFAFNGLVGAIILQVVNSGALSRPIDVLNVRRLFSNRSSFRRRGRFDVPGALPLDSRAIPLEHSGPRCPVRERRHRSKAIRLARRAPESICRSARGRRSRRGGPRAAGEASGLHACD